MVKTGTLFFLRKTWNPFWAVRIAFRRRPGILCGMENKVMIAGATIEDMGLTRPEFGQNMWNNILIMVKRYSDYKVARVTTLNKKELIFKN